MIDQDGYRPNVGIIIVNKEGKLFWGKRVHQDAWQFPQGGIRENETPQQAVFRELKEEVGLEPCDVRVLGRTDDWLCYDLPKHLIRHNSTPVCIGQKQIWFMLGLESDNNRIDLNRHDSPEFEAWDWVDYWRPVQDVVNFKQAVYHKALTELEHTIDKFWL
ncbi:RNA pyrophosphohydrolase [Thiomicrorhabdus sp. 6S2-11]|jgi:putative (di)nucleoside polyphosphate hydrolase|uniref:RNA pyrophosphohydrolase n=1 Tax=Thiomicrorhabdus marina TaxID=2818442 RepID=A0ABS3Q0Z0_9GAMM|nr:RNA pyrophosphohydrolase [Thiomicrorhabdus marina]MBO1925979.1 RNA pyrophosphohydrolase [Thiomicrorhabdus marina]